MPVPITAPLSANLDAALRGELRPSERILWASSPDPRAFGRHLRSSGKVGRAFAFISLGWIVLATAIMLAGNHYGWKSKGGRPVSPPPLAFQLAFPGFGIPFFIIGLYIAAAPRRAASAARYTAYAITDQRIIVIDADSQREWSVTSYSGQDFARCTREEYGPGLGDLIIGHAPTDREVNGRTVMRPIGLLGVQDPRGVQKLIERTLPAVERTEPLSPPASDDQM